MSITFVAIKPGVIDRRLIGEIISRFERVGFELKGLKMMQVTEQMARDHYAEHEGKEFFGRLIEYLTSGDIIAMAWEGGDDVVEITRKLVGATDPVKAQAGTIRGDMATVMAKNVIHASDSLVSAKRELGIFFPELK